MIITLKFIKEALDMFSIIKTLYIVFNKHGMINNILHGMQKLVFICD